MVLFFEGKHCHICHRTHAFINELGLEDKVYFLDAEDNLDYCEKFGVRNLPTMIALDKGVEVARYSQSPYDKSMLRNFIETFA